MNSNKRDASCFSVHLCIGLESSYGVNVEIDYSIVAEPDSIHSRVFFSSSSTNVFNSSINLAKTGAQQCSVVQLIFKKDNYDFITPIHFSINYNLANENEAISRQELGSINKKPIVHEDTNKYNFTTKFKTECGSENNCLTDLKLSAMFVNLTKDEENISILSFKESDSVSIKVRLENTNKLAYATEISVIYDERLDFIRKDDIVSEIIL